jgi:hypothetical protein
MTDSQRSILISGDWGSGKSTLALSYSEFTDGDVISCDFEGIGQKHFVAPTKEQKDPANGVYYVHRLIGPSVYEVKAIVAKIMQPTIAGAALRVDKKSINPELLSEPVRSTMRQIGAGELKPTTIILDTITRLCDLTAARVFNNLIETRGEEFAEKMTQLSWGKIKDDVSELLYQIITDAGLSLVMTAWQKNKYDQKSRRSTDEVIADVLRNVNAFIELSLMLQENPGNKPGIVLPPRAMVLKSRLRGLTKGAVIEKAEWPAIFAAEPKFLTPEIIKPVEEEE